MLRKCLGFSLSVCLLFTTLVNKSFGQAQLLPLDHQLQLKLGKRLYFDSLRQNHTALRQQIFSEVAPDSISLDSLLMSQYPSPGKWQTSNWLFRKIFSEHLIEVSNKEYSFYLDFLPDLQIGKQGDKTIWLNTRGIELGGNIGRKFSFTSTFYESQGKFADYITDFANTTRVIPGQGYARAYKSGGFDFGSAGGTISYTPSKYINFQIGYDKNFIGDGYRSLLLSDNSFNYPFAKLTGTLGKVRYMFMYAQFIDFYEHPFDDTAYPKKSGVFHYLDWNVSKRWSVGLFENVMWATDEPKISYIVPVVFLRPVEFANGSPDKVLVGLNTSYKIAKSYVAYGQLMINEFVFNELFSRKGSFRNKNGFQLGLKGFDVWNVQKLNAQLEFNSVRPYSYSSRSHFTNYGHFGQALAHPYGANFKELLGIVNYQYGRLEGRLQINRATYGLDINDLNYGKNIYKEYTTKVAETGVFIGQGLKTNLFYGEANLTYVLNPKNNLGVTLVYTYRKETNNEMNNKQNFFTLGIRSSFRNVYNDF